MRKCQRIYGMEKTNSAGECRYCGKKDFCLTSCRRSKTRDSLDRAADSDPMNYRSYLPTYSERLKDGFNMLGLGEL